MGWWYGYSTYDYIASGSYIIMHRTNINIYIYIYNDNESRTHECVGSKKELGADGRSRKEHPSAVRLTPAVAACNRAGQSGYQSGARRT